MTFLSRVPLGTTEDGSSSCLLKLLSSPIVLSFVGGVVSSSLVWIGMGMFRKKDSGPENSTPTFNRWVSMDNIKGSFDDIKTRIGELPGLPRRSRWPWDRHRLNKNQSEPFSTPGKERTQNRKQRSYSVSTPSQVKSDLCIGSIFGMDVGGTLAKLVYFEQKIAKNSTTESIRGQGKSREQSYRTAASAQAVLMARRGFMRQTSDKGTSSRSVGKSSIAGHPLLRRKHSHSQETLPRLDHRGMCHSERFGDLRHSLQSEEDLHALFLLRQESVPDDLDAYAETVHIPNTATIPSTGGENGTRAGKTNRVDQERNGFFHEKGLGKSTAAQAGTIPSPQDDSSSSIRKSNSMFDLSSKSRNHAQALDHFYSFARRLESYSEGLKDDKLSIYSRELGGEFHFIHFETRRMQQAMDLIRTNNLHLNIHEMGATGGGAHKYAAKWEHELGIQMKKQDELDSLVAGMQFVLSSVVGECYSFRPKNVSSLSSGSSDQEPVGAPILEEDDGDEPGGQDSPRNEEDRGSGDEWWWSRKVQRDAISHSSTFPYLVVTIGTGVSILRVDGPQKYERISGSTIGGGTYWGLIRLLTDSENFEDVMRLAARGDPSKVDMMVGDIYGENSDALEKIGLKASLVASSFGKLVAKEDPAAGLKQEDLARALLLMITNNIGQVAYLNAKLTKTRRIYFVGNFLRENKISQRRLSFAIDYWSKGEMEALFLEHEGYFGALGAFLLSQDIPLPDGTSSRSYKRASTSQTPEYPHEEFGKRNTSG